MSLGIALPLLVIGVSMIIVPSAAVAYSVVIGVYMLRLALGLYIVRAIGGVPVICSVVSELL